MSRLRSAYLLLTVAAAAALTSCAGVPRSSAPQVVQTLPLGAPPQPALHPRPGESARDIVSHFLKANAAGPEPHSSARQFLTEAAANAWSDTTATIIDDETIGTYRPGQPQVVVTGRVVGTLDANGVYTPSRQRTGNGGPRVAFRYGIARVHGQYRIDSSYKGLLLTVDQFQQAYRRRALYFFDLSDRYLVPDVRWSALTGPSLAEWLVSQLAAGPALLLQNAVTGVPAQAASQQRFIRSGSPMKVEITGSSQLDPAARNRLAAQIGTTLNDAMPGQIFQITDGGAPVWIPAARNNEFEAGAFSANLAPAVPSPTVFYLHRGNVVNSRGVPLTGPVNNGEVGPLSSVAVIRPSPNSELTFAGVAGGRLVVGGESGGLVPTRLHGKLTRPAFVPGRDEVWIGDGGKLYRVVGTESAFAHRPGIYSVGIPQVAPRQRIVALQFSPEGSRVALIIGSPGNNDQLYVGAVVRTAGQVRVDLTSRPAPISPRGVSVTDVAWLEPLSLVAIGDVAGNHEPRIFNTNVDGSFWSNSPIGNLPSQPDSVTVVTGHVVWVSANGTVWYQSGGQRWASPNPGGETFGYAPIYLE